MGRAEDRQAQTSSRDGPQARRQAALLRLGTQIIAAHDEDEVCRGVVKGLHDDALGYDFLGLFLVDERTGERVLRASVGWADVPADLRVPPGKGLSEQALLDGKLHYTPDVRRDERYFASLASGSEVDLPLLDDGRVVGVLVVESSEPNAFDSQDFEILTAAANQASLAIARVRLLAGERRRADEQEALLATMTDLSAELELPRLLEAVLARAVGLLSASGGELAIYDDGSQELEVVANHNIGKESTGTRMKPGEGAMGGVAVNRQPLIIDDYQTWPGRSHQYSQVTAHAVMVAPLLMGGRLVGTIAIVHTDPQRRFLPDDLRLLNMFATQAAVAIENARLFTAAQQQKQYFEDLFAASPVAIVTLDQRGLIVSCNPAFQKLYGYSAEEAIGAKLDHLIATESMRSEALGYTRLALDRPVHAMSKRVRKDGEPVDVEIFGVPVIVEGKQVGALGIYHDITELNKARQEAEAANRAKSTFLANMSHELRTPLNAIIGYSELLQEEAEDLDQQDFVPDLQKIRSAGKHLLALINDVLDLSKIEAGRVDLDLSPFDLEHVIRDVATTVHPLVEKNANTLALDLASDLGSMHSDETKVRQILFNLLSNACKFTQRGEIRLAAGREVVEGKESFVFRITDTGVGMTAEQQEKVFEAFSQADASITRKYGGTGLGLAISRKFCHLMGGDIGVRSEPGQGSEFKVHLPLLGAPGAELGGQPAGADSGVDEQPAVTGPRGGMPVLVVDDDPAARDLLARTLRKGGIEVLTAAGGEEALRLAREAKPIAITLDVVMPRMDGWAVLSMLKADPEVAGIPVVIASVVDDRKLGYALGAAEYLTKPVDRSRLLAVVDGLRHSDDRGSILIVEDEAETREMLTRTLERDGWRVVEAADGKAALERLGEELPELILLDLVMPEMDGFEFVDALREDRRWRSIPVVVVTAKDLSEKERKRLTRSAERILDKSEHGPDDLVHELRRLVQSSAAQRGER